MGFLDNAKDKIADLSTATATRSRTASTRPATWSTTRPAASTTTRSTSAQDKTTDASTLDGKDDDLA